MSNVDVLLRKSRMREDLYRFPRLPTKKEAVMADRSQEESFFYGRITGLVLRGSLIQIFTRESELRVGAQDPGLKYISVGKRRLVVVRGSHIVAVYIRPRRHLFLKFGAGLPVTDSFLLSLRPRYFYTKG